MRKVVVEFKILLEIEDDNVCDTACEKHQWTVK